MQSCRDHAHPSIHTSPPSPAPRCSSPVRTRREHKTQEAAESAGNDIERGAAKAVEKTKQAGREADDAIDSASEKVRNKANEVREDVRAAGGEAKEDVKEVGNTAEEAGEEAGRGIRAVTRRLTPGGTARTSPAGTR